MKVIDLLNKIANGNIPKRIIYDQFVYVWTKEDENYTREIDIGTSLNWDYIVINCLNEPVEILDKLEDKKIEKIEICKLDNDIEIINVSTSQMTEVVHKINEIIDKINSMEK